MDGSGVEGAIEDSGELLKDCTPCIGMEFDSEPAAFRFYNEFGRIRGFSIRKDYATKSRTDGMIINRKFVCSKEGVKDYRNLTEARTKRETRTKCGALMYISLDRASLKWSVTKFDDTHNHDLHTPDTVHMMRTQRGLCESQALNAEIAESTGLRLKLSHDLISAQSGGKEFVGFMREDLKTHLRSRRERDLQYGEAGILIKYFQKKAIDNPYFFHTMQLDMDEMITNIFWADHQMIMDYGLFGDTLSFDTTFRTNKECRPLALFTGFNHHRMTVIFGVALMYDETTPSFVWLFQTFLEAMSGKKPLTFFTDQDQAMANALSEVMPDVKHGLCTFHLNQNAMKHLGYLGEDFSAFINDFNACMYGYEEKSELIEAWTALVKNYKLEDNAWVTKTWELQEKWAHVHMKWSFNAGMRSTQLSESLNAQIKRHLKSDNNLGLFFTFFDQAVLEKRYKEIQAKFDSREKMVQIKFRSCPMLLHVAKFYTPNLFDLFHNQFDISLACKVMETRELGHEIGFVVQRHGQERKYVVIGRVELDALGAKTLTEVSCSCRKFESFGILCGHAIKVLSQMNVMEIPEKYILGRWRLDAKSCSSKGKEVMVEDDDRKLVISARYRHLCPKVVTLVAQASEDDEAYKLVEDTITLLCAQVDNIFLSKRGFGPSSGGPESPAIQVGGGFDFIDPNFKKAKGLKKKVKVTNRGIKGSKRQKAWPEKVTKRGKSIPRSRFSQGVEGSNTEIPLPNPSSNQPTDGETLYYPQMAHLQSQASCSTQVSEVPYDESIHIPMEAESLFRDEEFLEALVNSNSSNSQY